MSDLISVIIPCYNVEKYVVECLQSIKHQTYKNLEIIVINDASTDNTKNIIERYLVNDTRIKFINLEKNAGLSAVRNIGIKEAKGKFLSFVDSDDVLDKKFYETLLSLMILDREVDIAQTLIKTFNSAPFISNKTIECDDFKVWAPADKFDLIKKDGVTFVMQGNKLFRSTVFANLRYPEGRIHEDLYLIYDEYKNASKVAYTNDTVYYYRVQREGSITASLTPKRVEDSVYAYEHVCQSAVENCDTNFYIYARKKQLEDFMYNYILCEEKQEEQFKYMKDVFNQNQNVFSWAERKKFKIFFMSPKIMEWLLRTRGKIKGNCKKVVSFVCSCF